MGTAAEGPPVKLPPDACSMFSTLDEDTVIHGITSIELNAAIGLYERIMELHAEVPQAVTLMPGPDGVILRLGEGPLTATPDTFFWCGLDRRSRWGKAIDERRTKLPEHVPAVRDGVLSMPRHVGLLGMIAPGEGDIRGTAILLGGLGGAVSRPMRDELTEHGWTVVRIESLAGQRPDDLVWTRGVMQSSDEENMFVEADIETDARSLTNQLDRAQCWTAAAAVSAVRELHEGQPDLANKPVIVVGISAGGFSVPATVQRLRDALGIESSAVAIIASGADVISVLMKGSLVRFQIRDMLGGRMDRATVERYAEIYRQESLLDPGSLAGALDPARTLMVRAAFDSVVPVSTGNALWERAGRPERWTFPGGHFGLFVTFGWLTDDIVEWLDATASK